MGKIPILKMNSYQINSQQKIITLRFTDDFSYFEYLELLLLIMTDDMFCDNYNLLLDIRNAEIKDFDRTLSEISAHLNSFYSKFNISIAILAQTPLQVTFGYLAVNKLRQFDILANVFSFEEYAITWLST